MNVLIVENEVYLARSIASKLSGLGYECEIVSTIRDALTNKEYDAVLLSTNISGQNFYPVLQKHSKSIVILMISYISNDTVSNPIKAGANDYIQKPFMIEELIRKLEHLKKFNAIKEENATYKSYIDYTFKDTCEYEIDKKIKLPILIKTNNQRNADSFVFDLSNMFKKDFRIISLSEEDYIKELSAIPENTIIYLVNLQGIKKSDKQKVFNIIKDKQVVIVSTDLEEESPIESIELNAKNDILNNGDILSIENYVKHIISNYQKRFPDTELSKKLGISRKSLWERRKKYGISKSK